MLNDVPRCDRRGATRFFWGWLITASAFSIAANVGHALFIIGHRGAVYTTSAVVLAIAPPLVQIAATHSVSQLVQTNAGGRTYTAALVMTVIVGGLAFALSFVAIRSLATFLGFTEQVFGVPIASIFPLAIDVSIGHATLCLLSLSAPHHAARPAGAHVVSSERATVGTALPATSGPPADAALDPAPRQVELEPEDSTHWASPPQPIAQPSECPRPLAAVPPTPPVFTSADHCPELLSVASRIVGARVTTKDPAVVADLLADHRAGLGPTAIAKKNDVHHSVVRKVLEYADDLAPAAAGATAR